MYPNKKKDQFPLPWQVHACCILMAIALGFLGSVVVMLLVWPTVISFVPLPGQVAQAILLILNIKFSLEVYEVIIGRMNGDIRRQCP